MRKAKHCEMMGCQRPLCCPQHSWVHTTLVCLQSLGSQAAHSQRVSIHRRRLPEVRQSGVLFSFVCRCVGQYVWLCRGVHMVCTSMNTDGDWEKTLVRCLTGSLIECDAPCCSFADWLKSHSHPPVPASQGSGYKCTRGYSWLS